MGLHSDHIPPIEFLIGQDVLGDGVSHVNDAFVISKEKIRLKIKLTGQHYHQRKCVEYCSQLNRSAKASPPRC